MNSKWSYALREKKARMLHGPGGFFFFERVELSTSPVNVGLVLNKKEVKRDFLLVLLLCNVRIPPTFILIFQLRVQSGRHRWTVATKGPSRYF